MEKIEKHVKEVFPACVAGHTLEIKHDDGIYRHICCSKNGSPVHRFNITTWPGFLAITGDMGAYVFERTEDMFKFFRRDDLSINAGYWAEKCAAVDNRSGIQEFSDDSFCAAVAEYMAEYHPDFTDEDDDINCLEDLVKKYTSGVGSLYEAEKALTEMIDDGFMDSEGYSLIRSSYEYTYRFLWCLFAIVWTIQKYDQINKDS